MSTVGLGLDGFDWTLVGLIPVLLRQFPLLLPLLVCRNIIPIAVLFVVLLFSWMYIHGATYSFLVFVLTFCHLIINSLIISSS